MMSDLIDRQATAKRLLNERKQYDGYRDIGIGLDIARMIVEDYCPTVQQNAPTDTPTDTPTDLISRQAAIDAIHEDADWLAVQGSDWQEERMERDKSILMSLPSAQRKGKWIYLNGLDAFECSVCGRQMVRNIFDYCPWCGARMEVEG